MHGFERLLSLWVLLCMAAGILLGRIAPGIARSLDGMTLDVNGAPVVSIPIAASTESLNAGIAASVTLYEISKQRASATKST